MNVFKTGFLITFLAVSFAGTPFETGYKVGDSVQDFSLKNVNGKRVSMSDFKNAKGFIIVFDCNTCPYSKAYNERIIALNNNYATKGFPLIAINSNDPSVSPGDSFEKMQDHARDKRYTFPYLFDENQTVAKTYGATNTPHVFILKKQDKSMTVAYIGAIDDNSRDASSVKTRYVENAIEAILENKEVPTTRTKAIGCTIKWRRS